MKILNIRIDNLTMQEALSEIERRLKLKKKFWIATPNPEMVVKAYDEPIFQEVLTKADISVPDGMGLLWLSKLKNGDLKERVAGSDLAEKLCARASEVGWKVFFLGGRENTAELALKALQAKYKGLKGEAYEGPRMSVEDGRLKFEDGTNQKEAIERINKYQPDILFVAFGQGKQELWIVENLAKLKIGAAMVVGGSFDFYAGKVMRAPKLVQKMGFEWLWRLGLEPWRWKRQLALIRFIYYGISNK